MFSVLTNTGLADCTPAQRRFEESLRKLTTELELKKSQLATAQAGPPPRSTAAPQDDQADEDDQAPAGLPNLAELAPLDDAMVLDPVLSAEILAAMQMDAPMPAS